MGGSEDVTLDAQGEPVAAKPALMSFADPRKGHHTAANCPFKGCPSPHASDQTPKGWTGGASDQTSPLDEEERF
jgi:hypothetical protein